MVMNGKVNTVFARPFAGDIARIVDVHQVGHFFLDEVAVGIDCVEVDPEDLLEARRVGEARIAGIALAAVALDDQELAIGERGEVADGVAGAVHDVREGLARVLARAEAELVDDQTRRAPRRR